MGQMTLEEKASQLRFDAPASGTWVSPEYPGGMKGSTESPEQEPPPCFPGHRHGGHV
ncbi:MAG: hypothetical protein ACLTW9_18475 [Enterocloster sp.]